VSSRTSAHLCAENRFASQGGARWYRRFMAPNARSGRHFAPPPTAASVRWHFRQVSGATRVATLTLPFLALSLTGVAPSPAVPPVGTARGQAGSGSSSASNAREGSSNVAKRTSAEHFFGPMTTSISHLRHDLPPAPALLADELVRERLELPYSSGREHPRQSRRVAKLQRAGLIAAFGDARYMGQPAATADVVAVAATPDGKGYWAASSNGKVFAFGDARVYGSPRRGRAPGGITAIAATSDGRGYWLISRVGDVFSFGDAHFYGSLGKSPLPAPVSGIVPTSDGKGYWLATARGGVDCFGDAKYFGSLGSARITTPVVGIAATAKDNGYWLATAGGGIFSFGGARFFGSLHGRRVHVTAIAAPNGSNGYWVVSASGRVYGFGGAHIYGFGAAAPTTHVSAIASADDGHGYLLATARGAASRLDGQALAAGGGAGSPAQLAASSAYLGTFIVTCYDLTGVTASGAYAGPESVAVDPSVIPLGTRIFIDGVGNRVADDTGGAIIGQHLDIWEPSYAQCAAWGVQYKAVYRVR